MLYKFKSRSCADVIFLEPDGRKLLHTIGKEPSASGIITVAQIPEALMALEMAVALDKRHSENKENSEENNSVAQVHFRQRAVPFIAMLKHSVAKGHDVIWGK